MTSFRFPGSVVEDDRFVAPVPKSQARHRRRRCQRFARSCWQGAGATGGQRAEPLQCCSTSWAALGPTQRCEVAGALRRVAETFAEVPDGRYTAHTLGALAHLLDSG